MHLLRSGHLFNSLQSTMKTLDTPLDRSFMRSWCSARLRWLSALICTSLLDPWPSENFLEGSSSHPFL